MRQAAFGFRVHSGWGALVGVSSRSGAPEIIERRRIVITDNATRGARQPYHYAQELGAEKAESYLAGCAAASRRLATAAIRQLLQGLREREYRVAGAAILLASGRALPALAEIVASHALIHTAEGEFFRAAFRKACEGLGIPVEGIRERELQQRAQSLFGKRAPSLQRSLAALGKSLGPPWTLDQKSAALAAWMILSRE